MPHLYPFIVHKSSLTDMKRFSTINIIGIVIISLIGLVLIFKYILSDNTVPPPDGFTASSVEAVSPDDAEASNSAVLSDDSYSKTDIIAPKGTVHALMADAADKMELGLSYRDSIADDAGMLFKFDIVGTYEFWMKDMKFPLDIVWVGENKRVVGIVAKLSPETYPNIFAPSAPILYALEINAGAAEKFGIATGTVLKF